MGREDPSEDRGYLDPEPCALDEIHGENGTPREDVMAFTYEMCLDVTLDNTAQS